MRSWGRHPNSISGTEITRVEPVGYAEATFNWHVDDIEYLPIVRPGGHRLERCTTLSEWRRHLREGARYWNRQLPSDVLHVHHGSPILSMLSLLVALVSPGPHFSYPLRCSLDEACGPLRLAAHDPCINEHIGNLPPHAFQYPLSKLPPAGVS